MQKCHESSREGGVIVSTDTKLIFIEINELGANKWGTMRCPT